MSISYGLSKNWKLKRSLKSMWSEYKKASPGKKSKIMKRIRETGRILEKETYKPIKGIFN